MQWIEYLQKYLGGVRIIGKFNYVVWTPLSVYFIWTQCGLCSQIRLRAQKVGISSGCYAVIYSNMAPQSLFDAGLLAPPRSSGVLGDRMIFRMAILAVNLQVLRRFLTASPSLCCSSSPESLWSPVGSIGAAASVLDQAIPTVAGVCSTTREYRWLLPPATSQSLPPSSLSFLSPLCTPCFASSILAPLASSIALPFSLGSLQLVQFP